MYLSQKRLLLVRTAVCGMIPDHGVVNAGNPGDKPSRADSNRRIPIAFQIFRPQNISLRIRSLGVKGSTFFLPAPPFCNANVAYNSSPRRSLPMAMGLDATAFIVITAVELMKSGIERPLFPNHEGLR